MTEDTIIFDEAPLDGSVGATQDSSEKEEKIAEVPDENSSVQPQDATAANEESSSPEASDEAEHEENELCRLKNEVAKLKTELERKESEQNRILAELGEFDRLFPDIAVKSVPNEVWAQVENGIPLCAAYALYEKEESIRRHRAEAINSRNAYNSAGIVGKNAASEYFSPEEVKSMTQKEVHENYSIIRRSMKHWR